MDTNGLATYTDPMPGRKGSDKIWETCGKCEGTGSVSWGIDVSTRIGKRTVERVCFECEGHGGRNVLVSSIRARVRRDVKRQNEAVHAAKAYAEGQAQRDAEFAAWAGEHQDVIETVDAARVGEPGTFWFDMKDAIAERRALTIKQVEAVRRIAAANAAEKAASTPVVEGRVEIAGKVISTKWVENFHSYSAGSTQKMVVADDRGFRVYGTVPSSLDVTSGDRVTFTASVEKSRDDENFGFFKRPTKASKAN